MPRYLVQVDLELMPQFTEYEVEADSREEAEDIAEEKARSDPELLDLLETKIISCDLLEEE